MLRYRDKLEIIAAVLNAAGEGAKKTKIMYSASLSFRLLEKYLGKATSLGFIFLSGNCYRVTERGRAFLAQHGEYRLKYSEIQNRVHRIMLEREALEKLCEPVRNNGHMFDALRKGY